MLDDDGWRKAAATKDRMEAAFMAIPGVQGVGVGLSIGRDAYALHVYVRDEDAARRVPTEPRDGIEVVTRIIGAVRAA
jgi:hypothetical protein